MRNAIAAGCPEHMPSFHEGRRDVAIRPPFDTHAGLEGRFFSMNISESCEALQREIEALHGQETITADHAR